LGFLLGFGILGLDAFNQENFTLVTQESAANYNKPSTGQNRTAQIGFRITF